MQIRAAACLLFGLMLTAAADAAGYPQTIEVFRGAGESEAFFKHCYAYAVFPTVGAGAIGIGGAYGKGRVYLHDQWVGNVSMGQVSLGVQLGGKAYSQIIFFEDARSLEQFESGKFEFGAETSAIAITSGANAQVATNGVSRGMSQGQHNAVTEGTYQAGIVVFVVAKGGLMASASLAGQRFNFEPLAAQ